MKRTVRAGHNVPAKTLDDMCREQQEVTLRLGALLEENARLVHTMRRARLVMGLALLTTLLGLLLAGSG